MEEKKENNNKNKVKISEKFSLFLRRKLLIDGLITFLIVAILCVGYVSVNLWVKELDLPEIDVTENKIYTLSDASKKAIENVDKEIKVYAYGFEENSSFINFMKQYNAVNDKITYEILTEENNAPLIQQYNLTPGYTIVILESGESKKVIDASTEFSTYNQITNEAIDTTEEVMTNSILALTEENRPKVYFLQGHDEYALTELNALASFLKNEAFETDTLNLLTSENVPDDCDILAIMSPNSDFFEVEVQKIKSYINKGGKIYFAMDTIFEDKSFPNLQLVLDEYGVSIKNGYVVEQEKDRFATADYPYIIIPEASQNNKITADIASAKTQIIFMFAGKLEYKDEATLANLNVTKETLLSTSDKSLFIKNVKTADLNSALASSEPGAADVSALLTKSIPSKNESGEDEFLSSEMIIVTCNRFISDVVVKELGSSYPLAAYGSNKDFVINGLSYLGDKGNIVTVRKDMTASSTYLATDQQKLIVIAIIFLVPLFIIFIGIVVWRFRRRRK